MKHLKRNMLVLAIILVTLLTAKGEVTRAAALTCGGWSIISSPNAGSNSNFLSGVATISAKDVWVVGTYFIGGNGLDQTLTEHWNGSSWSIVPSPNVNQTGNNDLGGVATIPANNQVWAAGTYDNNPTPQTLTEFYC